MITLDIAEKDDPKFFGLVWGMLNKAVEDFWPREIYVVQIDRAFDHKWFTYSGIVVPQGGSWSGSFQNVTAPPFNPNRVISEVHFRRTEFQPYDYEMKKTRPLHIRQPSFRNLHRRLNRIADSALYLWYSGDTLDVDQASLMIYQLADESLSGWYISFLKDDEWKINKTKGISRPEVISLIAV